jgi:O-antigen/teichoic acid export membrane protein
MHYNSLTLIIDAVLRIVMVPLFLFFGLSAYGAVLGFTAASIITGILAFLLFYIKIYHRLQDQKTTRKEIVTKLKAMFRYGLPLSAATILDGFLLRIYSVLIAIYVTDTLIGNYQVAGGFAVLVASLFLIPLRTSLFPTFSKINAQKESETLKTVFQSSVKYTSLMIVPATVAIMILSKPAISTIFGEGYEYTPLYLTLFVITYLYTAIGFYTTDNLIRSQGETVVSLKIELIKFIMGLSLGLALIPSYEILGLIVSSSVSMLAMILLSLFWVRKNYGVTINLLSSTKILLSAAIAAIPTYFISTQQALPNWMMLIIGATIYLVTYMIAVSLTGAINSKDTQNLREILKALGPLAPIITKPLYLIDFVIAKSQYWQRKSDKINS